MRPAASYSFNREAFSGGSTKAIEARTVETLSRLPSSRFLDAKAYAGLRGRGTQEGQYRFVGIDTTMIGTVSR